MKRTKSLNIMEVTKNNNSTKESLGVWSLNIAYSYTRYHRNNQIISIYYDETKKILFNPQTVRAEENA